jgi:hypothetical protein
VKYRYLSEISTTTFEGRKERWKAEEREGRGEGSTEGDGGRR